PSDFWMLAMTVPSLVDIWYNWSPVPPTSVRLPGVPTDPAKLLAYMTRTQTPLFGTTICGVDEGTGVTTAATVVGTGDGVGVATGVTTVTGNGVGVTAGVPVFPPASGCTNRKTPVTIAIIIMARTPATRYLERFRPGDGTGRCGGGEAGAPGAMTGTSGESPVAITGHFMSEIEVSGCVTSGMCPDCGTVWCFGMMGAGSVRGTESSMRGSIE